MIDGVYYNSRCRIGRTAKTNATRQDMTKFGSYAIFNALVIGHKMKQVVQAPQSTLCVANQWFWQYKVVGTHGEKRWARLTPKDNETLFRSCAANKHLTVARQRPINALRFVHCI